jgi:rhodanese-related sulfurtransferase
MNKSGTIKQVVLILVISVILALIVNAINSNGVSIFDDGSRYSKNVEEKKLKDLLPDPYDTSLNSKKKTLDQPPNIGPDGFVKPQPISIEVAKYLYDKNALFVDARTKIQFDSGHVKNAVNIPYKVFVQFTKEQKLDALKKFNKDATIVCYCIGGECEVSIDLAYEIAKLGFNYVNIYRGGYQEWEQKGYPVEK